MSTQPMPWEGRTGGLSDREMAEFLAASPEDEAERWVRVLRLHGVVGTALQSLGVGEAPLETAAQPASVRLLRRRPLGEDVVQMVTDEARNFARARSAFVRHIQADPHVAFHIADDVHLSHTRVLVEGTAAIVEGPVAPQQSPRLKALVAKMAAKYLGPLGAEYAARTDDRPRYLIRITPRKVTTWTGREWHPRYRRRE